MTAVAMMNGTKESMNLNSELKKPHLDIDVWLRALQLEEQYGKLFEKFSGVEDIIHYTGRELLELGVKNSAHRAQLQSGLAILREKYKNAVMKKNSSMVKTTTTTIPIHQNGCDEQQQRTLSEDAMVDGNMNTTGLGRHSSMTQLTCSDDENYINRRPPSRNNSGSPNRISPNLNSVNNNSPVGTMEMDDIGENLWYHGAIGRSQAETLVNSGQGDEKSGQFLVRDCISRAGHYVLTCNWDGKILHFMVNRSVANSNSTYDRAMFHFEDESYQSVPDLIRAYVGQKKPITEESQCVISKPINRLPTKSPSRSASVINLRQTVSEKSVLFREKNELRLVDEDREQGNYVRMRERNVDNTTKRVSIRENGIANLKIPQVPESIRNRPLPPLPPSNSSSKALTLRSRVMLKEARRQQLNKWRSESALEDTNRNNSDSKINPVNEGSSVSVDDSSLHASASLQSLDKASDKSNSPTSIMEAPEKPKRAPSLKNGEKRMVVIRDSRTGQFREIEDNETISENEQEDDEEECDYHEYCDIDYDQIPVRQSPTNRGKEVEQEKPTCSGTTPGKSNCMESTPISAKLLSKPPPLPPRPKIGSPASSIQDRDSACVPDMIIYDRPSILCKPYSPRLNARRNSDVYDTPRRPSKLDSTGKVSRHKLDCFQFSSLPVDVKPLDKRVWPQIRDLLLTSDSSTLALAATKMDVAYLNLLEEERVLDYVASNALSNLILMPHGSQFRKDIVERSTCWKFFVISSLLQVENCHLRTRILAKWIEVGNLVKELYANDFAFGNIMAGLVSTQLSCLSHCWEQLRQEFPKQATTFDEVMKPRYLAMQQCQDEFSRIDEISAFCIPNVEPLARLLDANSMEELRSVDDQQDPLDCVYGLDSFWHHLQTARRWPSVLREWTTNVLPRLQSKYSETKCEIDEIFSTEFHLRYLFGSRGATVAAQERYCTFERILTAMASNVKQQR